MSCNHLFMHLNKIKKGILARISGNFMFNKFTISLRPHLPISPSFTMLQIKGTVHGSEQVPKKFYQHKKVTYNFQLC